MFLFKYRIVKQGNKSHRLRKFIMMPMDISIMTMPIHNIIEITKISKSNT